MKRLICYLHNLFSGSEDDSSARHEEMNLWDLFLEGETQEL